MPDLDELLRSEISLTAAQAAEPFDFALIERRATQRRRRRTLLALSSAAAAVVLVVVGSLQLASSREASPTIPVRQPTPTADPLVNGPLQTVAEYLAGLRPVCGSCEGEEPGAFDQATGTVLLVSRDKESSSVVGLRVLGAHGQLARLTCPDDFTCGPQVRSYGRGGTALGPGADELTLEQANQKQLQVIGFDGALRRTIDLSEVLDDKEWVDELAWSPDRSRLVVRTRSSQQGSLVRRLWLVDRDGSGPQLVHTAKYDGQPPEGHFALTYVWSLSWSPDSSRLGFIEEHAHIRGTETSVSMRAMSLLLPGPGQDGPGEARAIYEYYSQGRPVTTPPLDLAAVVWSPDGTRVAVRAADGVLELSAGDGRLLARHPEIEGLLIWPARQP